MAIPTHLLSTTLPSSPAPYWTYLVNVHILTRSVIDACCTQLNSRGTGQKPTKIVSDVALSSLLLMRTYRSWYSNSFSNAGAKNTCGISPLSLLSCFTQHYLVATATSLDKSENKVQIHHLHLKRFHMMKRLRKSVQYIRRYSTDYAFFWPCRTRRSQMSCQLRSYWTEVHEIFTRYTGIICAVNAHIEVAISRSVLEYQSDKCGEFNCHFLTKLVAMAMSLVISEKEVQISHLLPKRFHLVKRLRKSVLRIMRYCSPRNH